MRMLGNEIHASTGVTRALQNAQRPTNDLQSLVNHHVGVFVRNQRAVGWYAVVHQRKRVPAGAILTAAARLGYDSDPGHLGKRLVYRGQVLVLDALLGENAY